VEAIEAPCRCGLVGPDGPLSAYLVELPAQEGPSTWVCSDVDWCRRQRVAAGLVDPEPDDHAQMGEDW